MSLSATKTADELLDPKIVLAWLVGAVGVPAFMLGLLVPIREAGALLPQLVIAAAIRSMPIRKWVWAIGSIVQGLCAIGIALAASLLDGTAAGWAILALTIGGVARLGAGLSGFADQRFGAATVLVLLALMCVAAMRLASGLDEVQRIENH